MKHLSIRTGIYSIRDLEQHYKSKTKGHWFEASTMAFFKSRLAESLVYTEDRILFFSSEKGPNGIRRYSIREYNPETGAIETVGLGFQAYKTLAAAKRAAQYLAKGAA